MAEKTLSKDVPEILTPEAFSRLGITHETPLPMIDPNLSNIQLLKEEKPYQRMVNLLGMKSGEPTRVMVDSGLIVAGIARLFEDTRSVIEAKYIMPFFEKITATLEKSSNTKIKLYAGTLKELLTKDKVEEMKGLAKSFADNPYATPQGFYSTQKARDMGLHKFFRALRWLGMAGDYIDHAPNTAVETFPFYFDLPTTMEIRKMINQEPSLQPGLESFTFYSKELAGEPDSVSFDMVKDLHMDASKEQVLEAVRSKAKELGIPRIVKKNGIPFTVLPVAYTATQAAYEGVQRLGNFATKDKFEEVTNPMLAYLGGDPDFAEVAGILNDIPDTPASAYQFMLAMGARLKIADPSYAALVLNMFAGAETTAAEAVVGLEKQQLASKEAFLRVSENELRLDPAITKGFIKFAQDTKLKLAAVVEANGFDPREMERYQKLDALLNRLNEVLDEGGVVSINPDFVEVGLGPLIELFNADPTAAVKVAEYNNPTLGLVFIRVNAVVPVQAIRQVDGKNYYYAAAMWGTQVAQITDSTQKLTREKLIELRTKGELPEGFTFMVVGADGETDRPKSKPKPPVLRPEEKPPRRPTPTL
jgi:hypothetical protein